MGNVKIKLEQLIKLRGFSLSFPKKVLAKTFTFQLAVTSLNIELRLELLGTKATVNKIKNVKNLSTKSYNYLKTNVRLCVFDPELYRSIANLFNLLFLYALN